MNIRHQRSSYRLLGLVGNGQFGRVYCGIHRKTGQLVAIKYLHRHSLSTNAFLRELNCLLSLSHTNIVACHALEHAEDGRRLILEYCAGGTLRSHMLNSLSLTDILNLSLDVLQGLAHAHQQGIIHCDIKPENILLSYCDGRWRAKISDFGIAKLAQDQPNRLGTGQTGSPAYMAPERFYRQYSPAADVYGVGVMLFELVVGHRPFKGTPSELQLAHLNQPVPEATQLHEPLQKIVAKALEKLPARRYRTAAEMLTDLQQLTESLRLNLEPTINSAKNSPPSAYTGSPLHALIQPVRHLKTVFDNPHNNNSPSVSQTRQAWMAYGSKLAVLKQTSLTITDHSFDGPIQGLYPSKTGGLMVATDYGLWETSKDATQNGDLTLLKHWQTSAMVTVASYHRWIAMVALKTNQLTITKSSKSGPTQTIRRPLPPDMEVNQILAVDSGHIAILGSSKHQGSRLLLWNRRGIYLTSLDLGISLQNVTPMQQSHQWMAIDANAPQTVILLTLKPLRMNRIIIDICPRFMLDLPWGYLFSNVAGQMLLLDRDFHPIGNIKGPEGITALTSMSTNELLVATWKDKVTGGALHQLNLQDFELDMIF
ncbi:MAG: serine/threonine protein kinase [Leptolyngbyaceae cyanobacterium MAG.088]|nr:serine/threonine protein kinase [Leptolyngbyaceae cyanobacterium MAG.088]